MRELSARYLVGCDGTGSTVRGLVAFGVLLDALLVRSVLVPALTLLIGRRMWWPSRLSRPVELPDGQRPLVDDDDEEPALQR